MAMPRTPDSPLPPPPPHPDYHQYQASGDGQTAPAQFYPAPFVYSTTTPTHPSPHQQPQDQSQVSEVYNSPPPVPAPTFKPYKPSAGKTTFWYFWIALLALRSFALVAALISFAIAASVQNELISTLHSLGYIIAVMVLLFLESAAFIVIASLQLLGQHLKGRVQLLANLIALILDQVLLLLCFGASCTVAAQSDGCVSGFLSICSRGRAASAMGFLASFAQAGIVGIGAYLLHLLAMPVSEDKPSVVAI